MPNGNRVVKSTMRRACSMCSTVILTFHCLPSAAVWASIRCPGCAEPAGVNGAPLSVPPLGIIRGLGEQIPGALRGCVNDRDGTRAKCHCQILFARLSSNPLEVAAAGNHSQQNLVLQIHQFPHLAASASALSFVRLGILPHDRTLPLRSALPLIQRRVTLGTMEDKCLWIKTLGFMLR